MNPRRYSIVIERTNPGYSAYSTDVSGCAAAGDPEEETAANIQEAVAFHLEGMREVGEAIPEACSSVRSVDVAA